MQVIPRGDVKAFCCWTLWQRRPVVALPAHTVLMAAAATAAIRMLAACAEPLLTEAKVGSGDVQHR